jgi:phosphoribosylformimino-5-aminoimidazole carboxamide ribotide isomerase
MIVIPAIDLRGGRCVRLFRGDVEAETVYDDDPVETAKRFEADGARRLHVVDLDAARDEGSNRPIVREICRSVAIPVQLGGGLRTIAAIESALEDGAARAILGTAAPDTDLLSEAAERFGDHILVAVDVKGGLVMTHAWQQEGARLEDMVGALQDAGAPRFIVTSIARDGTMDGPDLALCERMLELTDRPVIASGGVRVPDDVWALREIGVEAVVVGKAIYSGTLRMRDVVRG